MNVLTPPIKNGHSKEATTCFHWGEACDHSIQPGILQSTAHFGSKELFIAFDPAETSLRKVVELLSFVGYEPHITLNDAGQKREPKVSRK